jgi:hypothetical protein
MTAVKATEDHYDPAGNLLRQINIGSAIHSFPAAPEQVKKYMGNVK